MVDMGTRIASKYVDDDVNRRYGLIQVIAALYLEENKPMDAHQISDYMPTMPPKSTVNTLLYRHDGTHKYSSMPPTLFERTGGFTPGYKRPLWRLSELCKEVLRFRIIVENHSGSRDPQLPEWLEENVAKVRESPTTANSPQPSLFYEILDQADQSDEESQWRRPEGEIEIKGTIGETKFIEYLGYDAGDKKWEDRHEILMFIYEASLCCRPDAHIASKVEQWDVPQSNGRSSMIREELREMASKTNIRDRSRIEDDLLRFEKAIL